MNARLKTNGIMVPATRTQAEELLFGIGEMQREVVRKETKMNDELAAIKLKYGDLVKPLNTVIDDQFSALHMYAEANKDDLLDGKLKSCKMATGDIGWRTSTPKVTVRNAKVVLESLKQLGLSQFIRTKEEINKDAILADKDQKAASINGITITQKDEFWIKPFESEVEKAQAIK